MAVLSGDYLSVSDDKLDELEPVMTIVAGTIVYDRSAPATAARR